MPLIKIKGYNEPELKDYRARQEWLVNDDCRTVGYAGSLVSLRLESMRDITLRKTLEQMAEPGVKLNREIMDLYHASQEAICHEYSLMCAKLTRVAINPKSVVQVPMTTDSGFTLCTMREYAFIPVGAAYLRNVIAYMYRVFALDPDADYSNETFDECNTGRIALCGEALAMVSKEMLQQAQALQSKVVEADRPAELLEKLYALLRPQEHQKQLMKLRQETYGQFYGAWS